MRGAERLDSGGTQIGPGRVQGTVVINMHGGRFLRTKKGEGARGTLPFQCEWQSLAQAIAFFKFSSSAARKAWVER